MRYRCKVEGMFDNLPCHFLTVAAWRHCLQAEFDALRESGAAPAIFLATPYDMHTSRWYVSGPVCSLTLCRHACLVQAVAPSHNICAAACVSKASIASPAYCQQAV